MAKIGLEISIDVTKIDKSRIKEHQNGSKYLTLTGFVNLDEKDQYDNNGFITQKKNKDEPKEMKMPILGKSLVFWSDMQPQQQSYQQQAPATQQAPVEDDWEDVPF